MAGPRCSFLAFLTLRTFNTRLSLPFALPSQLVHAAPHPYHMCASALHKLSPRQGTARGAQRAASLVAHSYLTTKQAAAEAPSSPPKLQKGSSNIVPCDLSDGARRKLELQAQAQAALAAENSWWQDTADTPANLVTAHSPASFKKLIVNAGPQRLVVVDYLKPSCGACRRLFPKFQQIAASNLETLFIKVNVETDEMRELGQGMQVTHLPWFHLFVDGELRASFSANTATVSSLRAEIAANKPCTDPACAVY